MLAQARVRLAVVYFQAELWRAVTGEYPRDLLDMVEVHPTSRLRPLSRTEVLDPFSNSGLPFRYRVTPEGPEMASIGPDGKWGGWPGGVAGFFSYDDIVYSAANAQGLGTRLLHAAYSEVIARGTVLSPHGLGELMKTWRPRESLSFASVEDLTAQLRTEWNITLLADEVCFDQASTGLGRLYRTRLEAETPSCAKAISLLQEATVGQVTVLGLGSSSPAVVFSHLGDIAEATFWQMIAQQEHAKVRPLVEALGDWPGNFIVVMPSDWFDDAGIIRLRFMCDRLFGSGRYAVYRTTEGVAITELRPWGDVYLLVSCLGEFIPAGASVSRVREDILRMTQR